MKKEGLEHSAKNLEPEIAGQETKNLETGCYNEPDNFGRWLSNCIWTGCAAGAPVFLVLHNPFYMLNNYNDLNQPQLASAILGSFMLSGLVFGSLYYAIRGRKIPNS